MKKILFWTGSLILFVWALAFFAALLGQGDPCESTQPVSTTVARFALFAPIIGLGLQWLGKNKEK
jgi:hypothetical protein